MDIDQSRSARIGSMLLLISAPVILGLLWMALFFATIFIFRFEGMLAALSVPTIVVAVLLWLLVRFGFSKNRAHR